MALHVFEFTADRCEETSFGVPVGVLVAVLACAGESPDFPIGLPKQRLEVAILGRVECRPRRRLLDAAGKGRTHARMQEAAVWAAHRPVDGMAGNVARTISLDRRRLLDQRRMRVLGNALGELREFAEVRADQREPFDQGRVAASLGRGKSIGFGVGGHGKVAKHAADLFAHGQVVGAVVRLAREDLDVNAHGACGPLDLDVGKAHVVAKVEEVMLGCVANSPRVSPWAGSFMVAEGSSFSKWMS